MIKQSVGTISCYVLMLFCFTCCTLVPVEKSFEYGDAALLNSIVFYGDSQAERPSRNRVHANIVENIMAFSPRAVFHTGDLVDDGAGENDWENFNTITENLRNTTDFYPAIGNHEKGSEWIWYDNWDLPNNEEYYSVDIDNLHFCVIHTNIGFLTRESAQYNWIVADLETAYTAGRSIFLVFHHPLYSTGHHGNDENQVGHLLFPLIEKYNVCACISGHNHAYERILVDGVYYLTTGGGGGQLYAQEGSSDNSIVYVKEHHHMVMVPGDTQVDLYVFNIDMEIIDEFQIELQEDA